MTALSSRQLACLGIAAAVLASGLASVLIAYGQGAYADRYDLYATFETSAQGVFQDGATDVKLRGVRIGSVRDVELLDDGRVLYTLSIDAGIRVPATAEARLAPLSVFGPKYIEIVADDAGADSPALEPQSSFAATSVRPELTDVLEGAGDLFAAADPMDVIAIIDAVADASRGRGGEIGEAIDGVATLSSVAWNDRHLLAEFLPDVRTVSMSIASRSSAFLERLSDYRSVAQLVVDHAEEIDASLAAADQLAVWANQLVLDASQDFDASVRAAAAVLQGIYDQRALLPASLDTVGAFFDMLGAGMRLPGPDGKKLTALKGFITADLCLVFGVCVLPDGTVTAADASLAPSSAGPATSDDVGLLPLVDALISPVAAGP
jgi:phospholipid/cholesterol/gamma-HCH transport system substrate-binding protein